MPPRLTRRYTQTHLFPLESPSIHVLHLRLIACLHSELFNWISQDTEVLRQNLHDAMRATGSALLDLRRAAIHAPRDETSSAALPRSATTALGAHYCYIDFTEEDALPDNRSGALVLFGTQVSSPAFPRSHSHAISHTIDAVFFSFLREISGEEAYSVGDSAVHPIYVDDSDYDSHSGSDDDVRVDAGRECIVIDDDDPGGSESEEGLDDSDEVVFIKSTVAPLRHIPDQYLARSVTRESSQPHRSRLFCSQSSSASAGSVAVFGGLLSAATSSSSGSHLSAYHVLPNSKRAVAPEFASWECSSTGFASRYLAKFGFSAGAGLGARGQGVVEPVMIDQPVLAKQLGLDFVRQARERAAAKLEAKRVGERRWGLPSSSSSAARPPPRHSKSKPSSGGASSVPNWRSEETLAQRVFRMDHQRGEPGAGSLPSAAQRTVVVTAPNFSTLSSSCTAKRAF